MAALMELLPEKESFLTEMNALGLPGVTVRAHPSVKCGITGTHVHVEVYGETEESLSGHEHEHEHHEHDHDHDHEHGHDHDHHEHEHGHGHHHAHTAMADIRALLQNLEIPEAVKKNALAVYGRIAEAESAVHCQPVDQIHFHEVGSLDAVADVVGVCLLMHAIAPEQVIASPVHVGSGHVRCAHGILPVPAPAAARILEGVPVYGGAIKGELCTPTGAALLKQFVTAFGDMPAMRLEKTGYGMGTKDFEVANCVRAMLGETREEGDRVLELSCNVDDMTAEAIGFAQKQLLSAGALDVFYTAVGMKKGRPGTMITCLCRPEQREEMVALLFRHTTTLGVREHVCPRYVLSRTQHTVETPYGPVRVKCASGWGVTREKAEYEDVSRIAEAQGLSFSQTLERIEKEK